MNIYLAGKVDLEAGAWRDALLEVDTRWVANTEGGGSYEKRQRWVYRAPTAMDYDAMPPRWPTVPNTWVIGLHQYVGPYRLDPFPKEDRHANTGLFHGSEWVGCHGVMNEEHRAAIVGQSLTALHQADIVFAYINRPDCYGTLIELGYARALGKYVYVAVTPDATFAWDDYWFVEQMAVDVADTWRYDALPDEGERVTQIFHDALVRWTAYARTPQVVVPREIAASFSQIAKWSSDPRVRGEARRMLQGLA